MFKQRHSFRRLHKGSLTRDFRLQVFFMNQCPPGPQVFHWSPFEFFRKFVRYSRINVLSPVISCSAVSTTPGKNLSPVSLTPVNNLYFPDVVDTVQKKNKKPKIYRRCQRHREKLFTGTGVNDTADEFLGGFSDTGD
jgi:hypothetical protein